MATKNLSSAQKAMMSMDSLYRHYVINDRIMDSYEKHFKHMDIDIKLLRFAANSYGTTSDAYILYAIAVMGIATKEAISNFLMAYRRFNPKLQIYDPSDKEGLVSRLDVFASNGIIFRHTYKVDVVNEMTNKARQETVVMYTIEDGMLNFINQKLGTRVKLQKWAAAKALEDLIGWASCSFVATKMFMNKDLLDYKQCTFSSKTCGTVIMPVEVKYNNGKNDTYVAHIPAFLHHNTARQTREMYEESCLQIILKIRDYLEFRGARGQDPYVVIVCENRSDAENMMALIIKTNALLDYTQRLYFTSEGIFRTELSDEEKFFQMEPDSKGKYVFAHNKPSFLSV